MKSANDKRIEADTLKLIIAGKLPHAAVKSAENKYGYADQNINGQKRKNTKIWEKTQ